jgi:CHAT domain-containing protein
LIDSGKPAAVRKSSYLVEKYELVQEPSATALIELGGSAKPEGGPHPDSVAVFADPVYSKTDPRLNPASSETALASAAPEILRQAGDGIALPPLPRLPGSKREAMDIRQIAGPQHTALFLDFEANPATLAKLDWSQYKVLHIAAHAISNPAQPELSGIALSMVKPDGSAVNGVVRLHDVYRLHTPVELVVLSACSTSGGKTIAGEGVEDLARAFLVAGSRSVLAMQWGADDASTSELMREFYSSYLRADEPSPTALRNAQIRMIETPHHAAPYYWAGAVLEGTWRAR